MKRPKFQKAENSLGQKYSPIFIIGLFCTVRKVTFALYFWKVEIKFGLLSFYENSAFIFFNIQPFLQPFKFFGLMDSTFCDFGLESFGLSYQARNNMKNSHKRQLNKRTLHNLQTHMTYWHIKMCTLNRHPICESLVKNTSDSNARQLFMKIPKNAIKSNGLP